MKVHSSSTFQLCCVGIRKAILKFKSITVMPEPGGGAGEPLAPEYLADQLTLFQPGEGILSPPITTCPPIFSPSGITDYQK